MSAARPSSTNDRADIQYHNQVSDCPKIRLFFQIMGTKSDFCSAGLKKTTAATLAFQVRKSGLPSALLLFFVFLDHRDSGFPGAEIIP